MKSYNIKSRKSLVLFSLLAYFILTLIQDVNAQYYPLVKNKDNPANSIVYELSNGTSFNIGVGLVNPTAKFQIKHVFDPEITDESIFKVDAWKLENEIGTYFGSFQACIKKSNTFFGIYQTVVEGNQSHWCNFLESKLFVGDSIFLKNQLVFQENNDSYGAGITWETYDTDDTFTFTNHNLRLNTYTTPLSLDPLVGGVVVHGVLQTDRFRLVDGAGSNKVLVSDDIGNGTWSDGSGFHDDDWIPIGEFGDSPPMNLYLGPRYQKVGIGTQAPKQALHVCGGNILISRPLGEAPGSKNGSIYFGGEVTSLYPNGEWGIEYYDEEMTPVKGLNFWKVNTNSGFSGNFRLFLHNNGNVGINTSNPLSNFQVNNGSEKLSGGSAYFSDLGYGTSYLGYNAARGDEDWTFSSNEYYNGGCLSYGDINGNYHIVTVPTSTTGSLQQRLSDLEIVDKIRMTITKDGDVGIGTINTHGYKLAVQGRILCENLKVQLEEDWPDYVFHKDYQLMPLQEVENYINVNNHLPGIPSSEEIKEDGIDVSRMNAMLVQKVEELTRYIIDQQKQIEQQQKQIELLMKTIELN